MTALIHRMNVVHPKTYKMVTLTFDDTRVMASFGTEVKRRGYFVGDITHGVPVHQTIEEAEETLAFYLGAVE